MNYDKILQWFEKNLEATPNNLTEDVASFMRAVRSGQMSTPADFLAHFYVLHLRKQGKGLPKTPADYNLEFVEKASDFFEYVASRCLYSLLKKDDLVTYEDSNVPLLDSDTTKELKIEATEKGKGVFENFQKQVEEMYNDYCKKQELGTQKQEEATNEETSKQEQREEATQEETTPKQEHQEKTENQKPQG